MQNHNLTNNKKNVSRQEGSEKITKYHQDREGGREGVILRYHTNFKPKNALPLPLPGNDANFPKLNYIKLLYFKDNYVL